MENASSIAREDAFAGGVSPAESSCAPSFTEEKYAEGASNSSPGTRSQRSQSISFPFASGLADNASSEAETSSFSVSNALLWQTLVSPRSFPPASGQVYSRVRIACGVCLLFVAALLLCISAAAILSVYGGYYFTEGAVGQFMSNHITPLVIYVTFYPLYPKIVDSIKSTATLGVLLIIAALSVSLPLWRRYSVSPVDWLTSTLHVIHSYVHTYCMSLHSLVLLICPCRWCHRGSHRKRKTGEGEKDIDDRRRRGRREYTDADFSTYGATTSDSQLSSGASRRRCDAEDAGLQVDGDTGERIDAADVTRAINEENCSDGANDRTSVSPAAQHSVRSSLQTIRWWSAPFTRLKEVIKHLLTIVTARLRGPDAAEALPGISAGAAVKTAAAGATENAEGMKSSTSREEVAAGTAAAEKRLASATGRAIVTARAVGTTGAAVTELTERSLSDASKHAVAGNACEKRKRGEGDQEKGVRFSPMLPDIEGVSTDGEPLIIQRSRERLLLPSHFSKPTRDLKADSAGSSTAEKAFQPGTQPRESVSSSGRTKTDADGFPGEEQMERNPTSFLVEAMRMRGRSARAVAAGKRGDSESSAGSLLAESEVEEWLMVQETDGKRQ